jgi:hypothetical protein
MITITQHGTPQDGVISALTAHNQSGGYTVEIFQHGKLLRARHFTCDLRAERFISESVGVILYL